MGRGVRLMWTHVDRGVKNLIFLGCHKWMAPYGELLVFVLSVMLLFPLPGKTVSYQQLPCMFSVAVL